MRRNCRHYALIRPFDKDDLRMLAKVAGFFSNQAACLVPFELSPGQWQAFGNWFMSYLRLFRCHQQLWMMRAPTAICGFGVDRSHAELLLSTQPSVRMLKMFRSCYPAQLWLHAMRAKRRSSSYCAFGPQPCLNATKLAANAALLVHTQGGRACSDVGKPAFADL